MWRLLALGLALGAAAAASPNKPSLAADSRQVYALLSESRHQLNGRVSGASGGAPDGFDGVGFKYGGGAFRLAVEVAANRTSGAPRGATAPSMFRATLNGANATGLLMSGRLAEFGAVKVRFPKQDERLNRTVEAKVASGFGGGVGGGGVEAAGPLVVLETPLFKVQVYWVRYTWPLGHASPPPPFIDVHVKALAPLPSPSSTSSGAAAMPAIGGLLGQSMRKGGSTAAEAGQPLRRGDLLTDAASAAPFHVSGLMAHDNRDSAFVQQAAAGAGGAKQGAAAAAGMMAAGSGSGSVGGGSKKGPMGMSAGAFAPALATAA